MAVPRTTEGPPPFPMTIDENGLKAGRSFQTLARSEAEAVLNVIADKGVSRGVVYVDAFGNSPDPYSWCQKVEVAGKPAASGPGGTQAGLYRVVASYSRSGQAGEVQPQPGKPAVWRVERTIVSAPVDHDVSGFAIANVVDEPIDPPLTVLRAQEVLVARWYVEGASELSLYAQFRPYATTVNVGAFRGCPRGSLLCLGAEFAPAEQGLFLGSCRFEYRAPRTLGGIGTYLTPHANAQGWVNIQPPIEGWADIGLHKGTREMVDPNASAVQARYRKIIDANGPVTEAVRLSPEGKPVVANQAGCALVFYQYGYADFAQMGIPN